MWPPYVLLTGLLVLSSAREGGEDVKQMILRLPNAEAECRYVQDLATIARNSAEGAERLRKDSETAEAAGDLPLASTKMTQASNVLLHLTMENWQAVSDATNTLTIKRGTLPGCAVPLQEESQRGVKEALQKGNNYQQRLTDLTERLKGR
jgi:hypothetical protein